MCPQVLHHASYVARPAIVLECSAYVCVSECMLFGLTARCIVVRSLQLPERSLQLPCFCYLTFTLLIPLYVSPMLVPRTFSRVVHSVRCSPLRSVYPFPVPWFLRSVPVSGCVMCIMRTDLFYPLCIPLRAIYSDVMCALVCFRELFITVLCLCPVL